MKVLITGGTGFVGSFLLDELINNGFPSNNPENIICLVRSTSNIERLNELGVSTVVGDLQEPSSLFKAVKDIDIVFHIAARADDWAPWSELVKTNVEGTRNLLEACLTENIGFFVHTSSTGVYGHFKSQDAIKEDYRKKPSDRYQQSKWLAEKVIWEYIKRHDLKAAILRSPAAIGPRDTSTQLKVFNALLKDSFPLIGKGNNLLTFIDARDLARAMILAAQKRDITAGQVYNLYSFRISLKEYLDMMRDQLSLESKLKSYPFRLLYTIGFLSEVYAKIRRKPTTLNRYRVGKFASHRLFDQSKIQKELGYIPEFNAEKTLKDSVSWAIEENLIKLPEKDC
ncbi:MAG: NAD-dependent epimerase/dehydratase family protein [Promethearchaeota archaeon]